MFKLSLNLSLTHLRAQSACHEIKGDLSPVMLNEILETLRYPEIGVRVTGSAMFFPFCGDVIDLTR